MEGLPPTGMHPRYGLRDSVLRPSCSLKCKLRCTLAHQHGHACLLLCTLDLPHRPMCMHTASEKQHHRTVGEHSVNKCGKQLPCLACTFSLQQALSVGKGTDHRAWGIVLGEVAPGRCQKLEAEAGIDGLRGPQTMACEPVWPAVCFCK